MWNVILRFTSEIMGQNGPRTRRVTTLSAVQGLNDNAKLR